MTCAVCKSAMAGHPSKTVCSPECKLVAKREYDRARYLANREATIARSGAWIRNNRERRQQYDAAYRARPENAGVIAARIQLWKRSNIGRSRELSRRSASVRRARANGSGVFVVTDRDYARLLNRYDHACAYCRSSLSQAEFDWDHVVPIIRGGAHSVGNLVPACASCNRSKSVRLVLEWRMGRVVPNRFRDYEVLR